jgi:polyisoprenoid-binding protein YceI
MPVFVLARRPRRATGRGTLRERKVRMTAVRYTFDSVRSCIWVSGRSSLHPINTETRGITGWFETAVTREGYLNLDQPVSGELNLSVDRLTSGNSLYDRELKRRMDARRYPTIVGQITQVSATDSHPLYLVKGDISFHGSTRTFEHEMSIEVSNEAVSLTGDYVFDIREFGMEPPSMLMVRVYPEIRVRIELHGERAANKG